MDLILEKIALLGHWAYLLIFLSALLETSAFIGLIIPGETIVVFSGFLASQGALDVGDCIWIIALGAILGDSIGYEIGRRMGRSYFETHERFFLLKKSHLEKAQSYFQIHGGKTIFFGRFIGFLRAFAPLIAGMSKMPYRKFFVYNMCGGVLWAICFTLLGFYFGHSWRVVELWAGKSGLLLFFILVLFLAFGYISRRILSKKNLIFEWVESQLRRCRESTLVQNFIARHPKTVNFLRDRISAKHYLGLHLTVGLGISATFIKIFTEITENIFEAGGDLNYVDTWVLDRTIYLQSPFVTSSMRIFTNLGDSRILTILTILLVFYFLLRKHFAFALLVLSAMIGGSLLSQVLKYSIHRARPSVDHLIINAQGFSFPSGHSMMSTIFYGLLIYFLARSNAPEKIRLTLSAALGSLIVLIGLSRIYFQVHYLSDVIAGFTGGFFYLILCLTGLEVYIRRKSEHEDH